MSLLPEDCLYTEDHEWLRQDDNGTATIGITDYAQQSLGDITFVEFPEVGAVLCKGDTFGVIESVKAASDLYMPVTAEILEINEAVDGDPALVNQEAFAGGWLIRVRLQTEAELSDLLSPDAYSKLASILWPA